VSSRLPPPRSPLGSAGCCSRRRFGMEEESAALGARLAAAREALGRAEEDEGEKERAAALEARLGELEADAAALAIGEHGVLLAALLRDAEEESAALAGLSRGGTGGTRVRRGG
jgi:hypothetical protein